MTTLKLNEMQARNLSNALRVIRGRRNQLLQRFRTTLIGKELDHLQMLIDNTKSLITGIAPKTVSTKLALLGFIGTLVEEFERVRTLHTTGRDEMELSTFQLLQKSIVELGEDAIVLSEELRPDLAEARNAEPAVSLAAS